MKTRNVNLYRATLSGLRTVAFGKATVLPWVAMIELYQARVSPELWRARPKSGRADHNWEASTAAHLMEKITGDFESVIKPWTEFARIGTCLGPVDNTAVAPKEVKRAG